MSLISQGLEVGRRALHAQQLGLNVTGHNIANVNTPGFSRRRVDLSLVTSEISPLGDIGAGVEVLDVLRQQSHFMNAQVRLENQILGRWEFLEQAMSEIEGIFNEMGGAGASEAGAVFSEPSGTGISGSLNRFWNAWQDLAGDPEGGAARAAVRAEGDALVTSFHQLADHFSELRAQLDAEVVSLADEVNALAERIVDLNRSIPTAKADGGTAGDLEDQRDVLIEELSKIVEVEVVERENGHVLVSVGGHHLVDGLEQTTVVVNRVVGPYGDRGIPVFEDDRIPVQVSDGKLGGLLEIRDEVILDTRERLDNLAGTLVEFVNELHRGGFGRDGSTDKDFFDPDGTGARAIALSQDIRDDLDNIAASADGNPGDNEVALNMANLRQSSLMADRSMTFEDFYLTLLGDMGSRAREASTMAENHRLLSMQLENRRQNVQGVSLNEEATNMIVFQRAYQAAARVVTIIDQLLETTINI